MAVFLSLTKIGLMRVPDVAVTLVGSFNICDRPNDSNHDESGFVRLKKLTLIKSRNSLNQVERDLIFICPIFVIF